MVPPVRVAILECDTPLPETRKKYGGYGGVFTALLKAGADYLNKPELISSQHGLEISIFDVVNNMDSYPSLADVDGILITGSKHNSFDNDAWILKLVEFTRKVVEEQTRVRLIGVCFGHQIIGRAMGVQVGRNPLAWEVAVTDVQLSEKGKMLFGKDVLSIHQMHRDIVYTHPPSTTPLGETSVCKVQGMYIEDRILGVQGHPEFNEAIVREIVEARYKQGIFDSTVYKDAMGRVANHQDGVLIGRAFLVFLLNGFE